MGVSQWQERYLAKAEESLTGAQSELASRRYNNTTNRCYYACFQAAVSALIAVGIRPTSPTGDWSHRAIQAQFTGQLINRRKLYSSDLGDVLTRLFTLRQTADYDDIDVSEIQASRALRRAREFVLAVRRATEANR